MGTTSEKYDCMPQLLPLLYSYVALRCQSVKNEFDNGLLSSLVLGQAPIPMSER